MMKLILIDPTPKCKKFAFTEFLSKSYSKCWWNFLKRGHIHFLLLTVSLAIVGSTTLVSLTFIKSFNHVIKRLVIKKPKKSWKICIKIDLDYFKMCHQMKISNSKFLVLRIFDIFFFIFDEEKIGYYQFCEKWIN